MRGMTTRAVAVQEIVAHAGVVLEVFPADAAVLAGDGRGRAEVALARVATAREADERAVTAVAPVVQEVVVRAEAVRKAVARAMTVREVVVHVRRGHAGGARAPRLYCLFGVKPSF